MSISHLPVDILAAFLISWINYICCQGTKLLPAQSLKTYIYPLIFKIPGLDFGDMSSKDTLENFSSSFPVRRANIKGHRPTGRGVKSYQCQSIDCVLTRESWLLLSSNVVLVKGTFRESIFHSGLCTINQSELLNVFFRETFSLCPSVSSIYSQMHKAERFFFFM